MSSGQLTSVATKDLLASSAFVVSQPPLINDLRDKPADVGMHSSRYWEENSAVRRNGIVPGEKVLKRRKPTFSGMGTLDRLGELHRVANQHDILGAGGH